MCEYITTHVLLLLLDEVYVCQHAFILVASGKFGCYRCQPLVALEKKYTRPVMTALLCKPAREISWRTKLMQGEDTETTAIGNRYAPFFRKFPDEILQIGF
jgi:hypothetical protein